ncbi:MULTISPECIES: hypothetical protein [Nostoc]|uniref:hypothetical protein n=1 Tax=Nostoc TaxID=1177 RepID=UPI0013D0318B|nr:MULTISPECIES: hypothetical protein [unclassified Nostoc]MDZ8086022.1 hypothetical protein [Nostoc sp. DedQUE12b]MDZ8133066.1 hypothetical protein [Nostoc sp. DedQUE07]MDZ8234829.1 hypothetical protein [Nostoc sp. ChiQUE02]NEU80544.1 hypothetical protein [Nostoc sp. UIC 10630]
MLVRLSPSPEEQRIDAIRQLPLEPMEYCRRWVDIDPARGYRKACINALAQATGLSPHTIKDWGTNFDRRPHYIPFLLRQADLLNQFKQLVISQQIILPTNFLTN